MKSLQADWLVLGMMTVLFDCTRMVITAKQLSADTKNMR